jgi:hypothetical protein
MKPSNKLTAPPSGTTAPCPDQLTLFPKTSCDELRGVSEAEIDPLRHLPPEMPKECTQGGSREATGASEVGRSSLTESSGGKKGRSKRKILQPLKEKKKPRQSVNPVKEIIEYFEPPWPLIVEHAGMDESTGEAKA